MSTIIAFFGSFGLTSPKAFPAYFSYWPTPAKEWPPKVGFSWAVIWTLVMRASAAVDAANAAVMANAQTNCFRGELARERADISSLPFLRMLDANTSPHSRVKTRRGRDTIRKG